MKQKKIVLVDDTVAYLFNVAKALKGKYKVSAVKSGERLFKHLEKNTPDLILLDIDMPEMDSFEILKKLKVNPGTEHIPVIFLTSRDDPESIQGSMLLGVVGYINKPYTNSVLLGCIDTVLKDNAGTPDKQSN